MPKKCQFISICNLSDCNKNCKTCDTYKKLSYEKLKIKHYNSKYLLDYCKYFENKINQDKYTKWCNKLKSEIKPHNCHSCELKEKSEKFNYNVKHLSSYNNFEIAKAKRKWIGTQGYNTKGTLMTVIDYYNKDNIRIRFEDDYKFEKDVNTTSFKKGSVSNPYDRTVFNIGIVGEVSTIEKEGYHKQKLSYNRWVAMLERCYTNRYPSYYDCSVCKEWLLFENFEQWFNENYYDIPNCRMDLDKDLLIKGNRIYSPETCLIIPSRLNTLITNNKGNRNGIVGTLKTENGRFEAVATIKRNGKAIGIHLGTYDTEHEAFLHYKEWKINRIKEIADEYKPVIPSKVYNALINFEVNEND